MTTHTKGPWHVGVRQAEQIVYDAKGWAVANATVYHGKEDAEEMKANARLIAAAPALLAALRVSQDMLDECLRTLADNDTADMLDKVMQDNCAAIAKATQG